MSFVLTNTSSTRRKKRSSRKKEDGITRYNETKKPQNIQKSKLPNFERTKLKRTIIKNPKKSSSEEPWRKKKQERDKQENTITGPRIPIIYYNISLNNLKFSVRARSTFHCGHLLFT